MAHNARRRRKYVANSVTCAQNKGTVNGPAPILEYPLHEAPFDIISTDLLQLPESQSRGISWCV